MADALDRGSSPIAHEREEGGGRDGDDGVAPRVALNADEAAVVAAAGVGGVGFVEAFREGQHAATLRWTLPEFGATRARLLAENLGDAAPREVVPPRAAGAPPRAAKYQAALDGGHEVLVLTAEVWGGFAPEATRLLGELAQQRDDSVDLERASATFTTRSFTAYHGQLLSLAVQLGVAAEIDRAVTVRLRPVSIKTLPHDSC